MRNIVNCLSFTLVFVGLFCNISSNVDSTRLLWRTLNALERGLSFLQEEYIHLNLDAIIGTRIVEGQLSVLLRHLTSRNVQTHVSSVLVDKIRHIKDLAGRVSDLSTPYVKTTQPLYYKRIGAILAEGFWTLDNPSLNVDRSLILPHHTRTEAMQENDSDDCLTELFGTSGKTTERCKVSQKCWNMMTKLGYSGYSLSHEVFYLQIGEACGCFKDKFRDVISSLNSGFCANMFDETEEIFAKGYPEDRQDLFMENPALCGMEGYRQFFRNDWLEEILSWQWPRGCWGSLRKPRPKGTKGRFKREEKQLPDGCECHRTAVAVGALTQYVRYILEYIQLQGVETIMR